MLESRGQILGMNAHRRVVPAFDGVPQVLYVAPQPSLLAFELFNDLLGYEHGYRVCWVGRGEPVSFFHIELFTIGPVALCFARIAGT
jgi:hypothetical protein